MLWQIAMDVIKIVNYLTDRLVRGGNECVLSLNHYDQTTTSNIRS